MFPHTFADLLQGWLTGAAHPGVTQVQTCADIGRHEQPIGVVITLSDGWRFLLQCVGTYPMTGFRPEGVKPEQFDGTWEDRVDYREARQRFAADMASYGGSKTRKPQAGAGQLLGWVLEVVQQGAHPELGHAEVSASSRDSRTVLRVVTADRSNLYGLPAGFLAPGATDLAHPAHAIPADWL